MCLAQGHNTVTLVGFEPRTSRFGVRRSTTTPPRSLIYIVYSICIALLTYIRKRANDRKLTYEKISCNGFYAKSACLVFNPIMVDNYASFFNCTPVDRASDSMMVPT